MSHVWSLLFRLHTFQIFKFKNILIIYSVQVWNLPLNPNVAMCEYCAQSQIKDTDL